VDEDEDLPRGDEPPYAPWWLTDDGTKRMRALETELKQLTQEYERDRLKQFEF
jgi:hypothetical protein